MGKAREKREKMPDSKEHHWKIQKRIVLKGWAETHYFVGIVDEAINEAARLLEADEACYQVRFAQSHHAIQYGTYIPQWLEEGD